MVFTQHSHAEKKIYLRNSALWITLIVQFMTWLTKLIYVHTNILIYDVNCIMLSTTGKLSWVCTFMMPCIGGLETIKFPIVSRRIGNSFHSFIFDLLKFRHSSHACLPYAQWITQTESIIILKSCRLFV